MLNRTKDPGRKCPTQKCFGFLDSELNCNVCHATYVEGDPEEETIKPVCASCAFHAQEMGDSISDYSKDRYKCFICKKNGKNRPYSITRKVIP